MKEEEEEEKQHRIPKLAPPPSPRKIGLISSPGRFAEAPSPSHPIQSDEEQEQPGERRRRFMLARRQRSQAKQPSPNNVTQTSPNVSARSSPERGTPIPRVSPRSQEKATPSLHASPKSSPELAGTQILRAVSQPHQIDETPSPKATSSPKVSTPKTSQISKGSGHDSSPTSHDSSTSLHDSGSSHLSMSSTNLSGLLDDSSSNTSSASSSISPAKVFNTTAGTESSRGSVAQELSPKLEKVAADGSAEKQKGRKKKPGKGSFAGALRRLFYHGEEEAKQEKAKPKTSSTPKVTARAFLTQEFRDPCTWNTERGLNIELAQARARSLNDQLDESLEEDTFQTPVEQLVAQQGTATKPGSGYFKSYRACSGMPGSTNTSFKSDAAAASTQSDEKLKPNMTDEVHVEGCGESCVDIHVSSLLLDHLISPS